MTPEKVQGSSVLLNKSLDWLEKFLSEGYEETAKTVKDLARIEDLRMAFAYRHARNIHDLGHDVRTLTEGNRFVGARMILRTMLESLFQLGAALKSGEFASEKVVAECEHNVKWIQKWVEFTTLNGGVLDMNEARDAYASMSAKIQREHVVAGTRKWNVFQISQLAGMEEDYLSLYALGSSYSHASIGGIISQENSVGGAFFQLQTVRIVLTAVGYGVQIVPTKNGQWIMDRTADMLGELQEHLAECS